MFENMDWIMLIGQALGVVAVILGFVTYQMKSPKALLIVNLITCGVFCLHYLLIGAISGAVMNGLGILRNVVYTNRDKKIFSSPAWPFIWAAVMLVAGLITWQDWRSVLMVCALVINSMALSMKNAQHIRYSLLITCPLVMIYDVLLHSYGGIVYEGMSIYLLSSALSASAKQVWNPNKSNGLLRLQQTVLYSHCSKPSPHKRTNSAAHSRLTGASSVFPVR